MGLTKHKTTCSALKDYGLSLQFLPLPRGLGLNDVGGMGSGEGEGGLVLMLILVYILILSLLLSLESLESLCGGGWVVVVGGGFR